MLSLEDRSVKVKFLSCRRRTVYALNPLVLEIWCYPGHKDLYCGHFKSFQGDLGDLRFFQAYTHHDFQPINVISIAEIVLTNFQATTTSKM